jgi:hypothetical protein
MIIMATTIDEAQNSNIMIICKILILNVSESRCYVLDLQISLRILLIIDPSIW